MGFGRELHALAAFDLGLELLDQFLEGRGGKLGIDLNAEGLLLGGKNDLEGVMVLFALGLHVQNHVTVHGDEAAVAVVGKALVTRRLGQALGGFVVQAQVEDGVHHPRHGGTRARAHGNQQWVLGIAELLAE